MAKQGGQQQQAAPAAAAAPTNSGSLLDRIKAEVAGMKPDDVKEALAKIQKQREKLKSYVGRPLSPEQKEKAKARAKEYMNRPEVKAKMKAYIQRPEVRERMRAQNKAKRERDKLILQKAKEMGLA
jgi:hypothetical protein